LPRVLLALLVLCIFLTVHTMFMLMLLSRCLNLILHCPKFIHSPKYCIILTLGLSHRHLPDEPNLFFVTVTTVLGQWT
jgi:hypothetical protein